MKIKDIVVEGVLDFAKGLWKTGSMAGATAVNQQAQAAKQQAQATQQLKPFIDSIINSWNRYAGLSGKRTASNAVEWAATNFKSDISSVNPPANNSAQEINRFLTDVSKSYKAGVLKSTAGTGKKYKPRQSAITPIQPTASGTIGATGKRGAAPASTPGSLMSTPAGVKVLNPEPLTLQFGSSKYVQGGPRGEWTVFGSTKPIPPAEQEFLNKQVDILHPPTP